MKLVKGFVLRQMCGENVVTGEGLQHINFNKLITLNDSAAYLWNELQNIEFDVDKMADLLIAKYKIDRELAFKDSEALAATWIKIGIAEE